MSRTLIVKTGFHLIAGCSLTLLLAASGAAFAHGSSSHNGGDHVTNGGHGPCINCGSGNGDNGSNGGNWTDNGEHHHHHHPPMTANQPPLHGPGSSHNPIIYHPVHGPGSSHNPIVSTANSPPGTVRDHRTGSSNGGSPYNRNCRTIVGGALNGDCISPAPGARIPPHRWDPTCNNRNISGCANVRDHRSPPSPQCYGDLC